jgi:hypothetical protein
LIDIVDNNEFILPQLESKLALLEAFLLNFKHTSEAFNHKEVITQMKQNYKQLKAKVSAYMQSMLLIMEEDISYKKLF